MTQATHPIDWNRVAETPIARLRAVCEYANLVFEDETIAATWLSRAHRAVNGGLCAVGAACQTPHGFREAVAELARIQRLGRDQAHELARVRPWLQDSSRSSTGR